MYIILAKLCIFFSSKSLAVKNLKQKRRVMQEKWVIVMQCVWYVTRPLRSTIIFMIEMNYFLFLSSFDTVKSFSFVLIQFKMSSIKFKWKCHSINQTTSNIISEQTDCIRDYKCGREDHFTVRKISIKYLSKIMLVTI